MKNILFVTQSNLIEVFSSVAKKLSTFFCPSFYVADRLSFDKYADLEFLSKFKILKEWEILEKAANLSFVDYELIEKYEFDFEPETLWNAVIADRRLYYGKKYSYYQDYKTKYTHEELLKILSVALKETEEFIDSLTPAAVISFQGVTLGDYLTYIIAKRRGIRILNLRPTRIKNYFYAGEDIYEPSERLKLKYGAYLKNGIPTDVEKEARYYMESVYASHTMYEGVVPPSNLPPKPLRKISIEKDNIVSRILRVVRLEYEVMFGKYKYDNYMHSYIATVFGKGLFRKLRALCNDLAMKEKYVRADDLDKLNYAFFPLHTEPEVTLSLYSRPYLNQLEAIRLISRSLPVGMKLIVKEHPCSIGKRKPGYYRKILNIPNVLMSDPSMKSTQLIAKAGIILVIAGSIGLEAILLRKPVITLGRAPYIFLPGNMVRFVQNPYLLSREIRGILEDYKFEGEKVLSYIAAVISESVAVDFYSRLLRRPEAYNPDDKKSFSDEKRVYHISALSKYLEERIKNG